jgi:hypothetical protein
VPSGASRIEWCEAWYEHLNRIGETDVTESPEYLSQVEKWRRAWRPERVKVLLVAESHVGEMPGDTGVRLSVPRSEDKGPPGQLRQAHLLPRLRRRRRHLPTNAGP